MSRYGRASAAACGEPDTREGEPAGRGHPRVAHHRRGQELRAARRQPLPDLPGCLDRDSRQVDHDARARARRPAGPPDPSKASSRFCDVPTMTKTTSAPRQVSGLVDDLGAVGSQRLRPGLRPVVDRSRPRRPRAAGGRASSPSGPFPASRPGCGKIAHACPSRCSAGWTMSRTADWHSGSNRLQHVECMSGVAAMTVVNGRNRAISERPRRRASDDQLRRQVEHLDQAHIAVQPLDQQLCRLGADLVVRRTRSSSAAA